MLKRSVYTFRGKRKKYIIAYSLPPLTSPFELTFLLVCLHVYHLFFIVIIFYDSQKIILLLLHMRYSIALASFIL